MTAIAALAPIGAGKPLRAAAATRAGAAMATRADTSLAVAALALDADAAAVGRSANGTVAVGRIATGRPMRWPRRRGCCGTCPTPTGVSWVGVVAPVYHAHTAAAAAPGLSLGG